MSTDKVLELNVLTSCLDSNRRSIDSKLPHGDTFPPTRLQLLIAPVLLGSIFFQTNTSGLCHWQVNAWEVSSFPNTEFASNYLSIFGDKMLEVQHYSSKKGDSESSSKFQRRVPLSISSITFRFTAALQSSNPLQPNLLLPKDSVLRAFFYY